MSPARRLYTVFETIDEKHREVYVGAAPEPWLLARRVTGAVLRHVEHDLEEGEAREFIRFYAATSLPAGWRFRTRPG